MALKDWKLIQRDSLYEVYEKGESQIMIKKRSDGYKVFPSDDVNLNPKEFKTKIKALRYVRAYMREN